MARCVNPTSRNPATSTDAAQRSRCKHAARTGYIQLALSVAINRHCHTDGTQCQRAHEHSHSPARRWVRVEGQLESVPKCCCILRTTNCSRHHSCHASCIGIQRQRLQRHCQRQRARQPKPPVGRARDFGGAQLSRSRQRMSGGLENIVDSEAQHDLGLPRHAEVDRVAQVQVPPGPGLHQACRRTRFFSGNGLRPALCGKPPEGNPLSGQPCSRTNSGVGYTQDVAPSPAKAAKPSSKRRKTG